MALAPYHPTFPVSKVRDKVKAAFLANQGMDLDDREFKRALARGRYELKELEALIDFHKYRALRSRYSWAAVHGEL
jgi:hypothetical protein